MTESKFFFQIFNRTAIGLASAAKAGKVTTAASDLRDSATTAKTMKEKEKWVNQKRLIITSKLFNLVDVVVDNTTSVAALLVSYLESDLTNSYSELSR